MSSGFFSIADWVIIFVYLLGIIALGIWFGKDQRNTRDYFLGQWDRFKHEPWGILAHSTHVRGVGSYANGVEKPRVQDPPTGQRGETYGPPRGKR